jgi:hypothetical protein
MNNLSLYQASIPLFIRGLKAMRTELELGRAFATTRDFAADVLASARLFPDMLSLSGQIQRASDTSKFSAERLSGVLSPKFADIEQTLPELTERIQNTIAYLETIKPEHFAAVADQPIVTPFGSFTPEAYLLEFALPNFYFHVATVHALLRSNGVPVGKLDYLGLKPR